MKEIPLISKNVELLLQAALLSGETAKTAYKHWKNAVDLDFLDDKFSYYLLPKLYLNQQNNAETDKTLKKLKGIYRRTWLENQLRMPQLLNVFRLFKENDIDFIVLSQTPFILNLLKDKGIFSLDNFDLLIHSKQIAEADKILRKNGWMTEQNPVTDENVFYRKENSAQIILRQSQNYYSESIWKTAAETDFDDIKIKNLSLNQRILSLCKPDFDGNKNELWAFHFYLIFTKSAIDWKNLIATATKFQVCAELLAKLNYLNVFFAVNIPPKELEKLEKEVEKGISPPGKWQMAIAAYQSLQKSYRRNLPDNISAPSFWGFIKFLREHWQINTVLFVPWQIGKRWVRSNGRWQK